MKKTIIGVMAGMVVGYVARKMVDKLNNMKKRIEHIEAEMELDGFDPIDTDDITRKYPPSMAFICPECDALVMFHGTKEATQREIETWRQYESILCPYCDAEIEIDEWTRHILEQ